MYYIVFSILYADAFIHRAQVRLHTQSLAFTQTQYRDMNQIMRCQYQNKMADLP